MKILFVCNNLEVGGVQKALINLLKNLPKRYEIELLVFNLEGEFIDDIPSHIKLIESNSFLRLLGIKQESLKKSNPFFYLIRGILVLISKVLGNKFPRKLVFTTYKNKTEYDLAISFTQDISHKSFAVGCNSFVLNKIKSKKKGTFIHSDFTKYMGDISQLNREYEKFDHIFCVSRGCQEAFLSVTEDLQQKTNVLYNCVDEDEILKLANKNSYKYNNEFFNIVTVARLTEEKGILRGIEALNKIFNMTHLDKKVNWHIIGDGNQLEDIKEKISLYNLNDYIYLHGSTNNPYKFMKNADLFLLTSFHEAAPLVFDEAITLKLPILTTDIISAKEMVEFRQAGYVCKNSVEGLVDALLFIFENKVKLKKLYSKKIMTNEIKVEKIIDTFDTIKNKLRKENQ